MSQILPSPTQMVFFVIDLNGITEFVSEGIQTISGYRAEELIGRPWWPTLFPDIHWRLLQNSLETNSLHGPLELALTRKDQTRVKTLWNISNRQDRPGCLEGTGTAAETGEREEPLNPDTSYRCLFENNQAPMLLIDPETGAILDGNQAAFRFYGYSRAQIQRKKTSDINVLPEDQIREEMQRAKQEERNFFSFWHRLAGGEIRDVEVYSGPIQMGNRTVLCSIIHDVTSRKQSEAGLAKSEAWLSSILSSTRDAILVLDPNLGMVVFNQAAETMFGVSAAEVLGQSVQMLMPEWYASLLSRMGSHAADGSAFPIEGGMVETVGRRVNGEEFPIEGSVSTFTTGKERMITIAIRDITQRKKREADLRRREQEFRTLAENSPDLIARIDPGLRFVYLNPAISKITGRRAEHLTGRALTEVGMSEDMLADWKETLGRTFKTGEAQTVESEFTTSLGKWRFQVRIVPELEEKRKVVSLVVVARDITSLGRMEQEMRQARDFYLTLFENFPALIWRIGPDGHDNYFNQTWLDFTGKTLDQELNGGWLEGVHPDDQERCHAIYQKAFNERQPFEMEYRLHQRDRNYRWVVDFGRPFKDLDGGFGGYIGTCFDITPQQEMMRAVQESEKRARRLAETLRAIARASQQASALLDLNQLGKKIVELLQEITGCYCSLLYLHLDGQLVISAEQGRQDEKKVPAGYAIQIGQGIIGLAAATGQPQNVADAQKNPHYMAWHGFPNTRSELAVPIRSANRLLGVIDMQSEELGAFDELDMETLIILADQLAVTIENARIFEELRDRTEELAGLAQVTTRLREAHDLKAISPILLQETMRLLKGKGAVLGLLDLAANEIQIELGVGEFSEVTGLRLSLDASLQGRAMATGKAVVIDNMLDHPEITQQKKLSEMPSRVCVPFKAYNRVIGTVCIGRERPFLSGEVRLITAIADIAANAIHREAAHEETVKSLKMLTALNRVATAINQTLESRPVLDLLLEEIHERLPVLASRIFIYDPVEQALNFAGGSLPDAALIKWDGLEYGPTGRVARERRALLIPDLRSATGLNPYLAAHYAENSGAVELPFGYYGVPLIAKGQVKGVLEIYYNGRVGEEPDVKNFIDTLAGQAATAIDNAELLDHLRRTNAELVSAYDSTIEGWSHAMDLRDKETEGHTQRVTGLTLALAREMGLYGEDLVHMRRGALLHDIGKMGIPDPILLKPGPLTDEEWAIMKTHPQLAFDLLEPIPFLRDALDIPYNHHERWDGTGYPRGLKGKAIPRAARIFAVVDVWDALSSDRPYRKKWTPDRVYAHIAQESGTHFDPQVVEVFLEILKEKDLQAKIYGWQGE
jgi:PAS domain S-box-containing protein/putative nucleotidyltransferase with HDIG domain